MSMMEDVLWEEENASPQRGSRAFGSTTCRWEVGGGGGGGEQLRRIRWDRFLPTRSLRVLLVEHDDSTRHIVAALLRKCSYHVAAVADGLKAWEVMKGKSYSFDLVLTEFEVPSLSGIGLLGKIVGTEDCKNIPVIMMSSQDSVGIVHKCMLKGAVDFLVKPLRKNELRNLWQHVWRRHCSNTYACTSENNAASNQISSNVGDWSHTGDTSDKGSDSDQVLDQSFGGKLDKKVEISRKQAEPILAKDGQFHRETGTHLEQPQNNTNTIAISLAMDDNTVLRDKTLVIEDVAVQPIQMALLVENSGHVSHGDAKAGNEKPNLNHQINSQEEFAQSSDGLAKSLANGQCSHPIMKTAVIDENLSTGADRSQIKHGVNSSSLSLWELSLMTKLNGCVQNHAKQNTILKHSNVSAFSRYGGTSTSGACKPNSSSICINNKGYIDQTPHVSCRGTDNVEPSASRVDVEKFQFFSDGNMEEDTACHSQLGFMPMPIPVGPVSYPSFCMGYGEPIIHQDNPLIVQSFSAAGNGQCRTYSDSHSGSIEFRCHDLNHPLPCRGQVDDTEAGEERGLSSSPTEEVYKNGSSSRDFLKCCGSNDSDDTMGDAAAATGAGRESGNENGIQNFVKNGMSSDLSHREAAIIKFRLKRKDRCFAKKVRYHSRQKLAEQRPRVKGQFVSKRS